MSYAISEEANGRVLMFAFFGVLTDAIALQAVQHALHYVDSHPPCAGIADFSQVTRFKVSAAIVTRLAASRPVIPATHMCIAVAPQDEVYGVSRMFQLRRGDIPNQIVIVRTMAEAWERLGLLNPHMIPVMLA